MAREGSDLALTLSEGERVRARAAVLAFDVRSFPYLPPMFASLPKGMVTHTVSHGDFSEFAGQDVAVIGRGQSALEAAAQLHEGGARVTLISRQAHLHMSGGERLALRAQLAKRLPGAFHALPFWARELLMYKHRRPAGDASLRGRVEGQFPVLLGWTIRRVQFIDARNPADQRVRLLLAHSGIEPQRELIVRHVVAGTGFRIDLGNLPFLGESLRREIALEWNGAPRLSRHFECTARGVYFVGAAAEPSFGPLMRGADGAHFASDRVSRSLMRFLHPQSRSTGTAFSGRPLL